MLSYPFGELPWQAVGPPDKLETQAIEIKVDHRCRVQREDLTHEQTSHYGDAQWLAQRGALPDAYR